MTENELAPPVAASTKFVPRPSRHRASKARLLVLACLAVLPSVLKRPLYRWLFGYRIGRRVRIGLTLLDAGQCEIGDDTRIGHGNIVIGVGVLRMGDHVRLGHLNILRGGNEIILERYAEIMRLNEINSIPEPLVVNEVDPCFRLGAGSVITANHKIDFTDRVDIGRRVILGGRNSSLWTHNRQRTRPIVIADYTYIGSEIRMTPGSGLPPRSIVGIGSVITKNLTSPASLIGGVPARVIKPLDADDLFLVEQPTRPDLPADI